VGTSSDIYSSAETAASGCSRRRVRFCPGVVVVKRRSPGDGVLVACLELELPNRTRCLRVSVRSGVLHALTEGGPAHDPLAALQVQLDQRLAGTPAHIGAALGRYLRSCPSSHSPGSCRAASLEAFFSCRATAFACFFHLSLPQPACLPVQSGVLLSCYPAHMNHVRVHIGPSIGLFPVPTCSGFPREGRLAFKTFCR
jgi:hypothetical protein